MFQDQPDIILKELVKLPYLSMYVNVMFSAMELDLFSALTEKKTAKKLAAEKGWHDANTKYLLDALFSLGFLMKDEEMYYNRPETDRYLVKDSAEYVGGYLLFSGNKNFNSMDIRQLLEQGPKEAEKKKQSLAFEQYADALRETQKGLRQKEILEMVRGLPENRRIQKILDIGCAAGLLGLALARDNEERSLVLYDLPPMEPLIKESIQLSHMEGRAEALTGDYRKDDIGEGYDLVLAVATFGFAKNDLDRVLKKIYDAMNPGGVLISISDGIQPDFSGPWDMILGWLPYYLQGINMSLLKGEVTQAALKCGFKSAEKITGTYSAGTMDIDIIRK